MVLIGAVVVVATLAFVGNLMRRGLRWTLALAVTSAFLGLTMVACGGSSGFSTSDNVSDRGSKETTETSYTSPSSKSAPGTKTREYEDATTAESTAYEQYEEEESQATAVEDQYVLEELPEVSSAPSSYEPPTMAGPEGKPLEDFLFEVAKELDAKWGQWLASAGYSYSSPFLQIYEENELSIGGCGGVIRNSDGPLYCSETQTIYYPYPWYVTDTGRSLEEFGDFAVAAVLAHEMAHHVQGQLGIVKNWNAHSIQMELQADCFAGVWASTIYYEGRLEPGDIEEAVYLLTNIADLPGTSPYDSMAHGTEQQRIEWFSQGYQTGDPNQCATY